MSLKRLFNRFRLRGALDQPGLEGETMLTRAVKSGSEETVREFLDLGADPDAKNKAGEVPLHIALGIDNMKILHLLLEMGADILKKQHGQTLSEHADKRGMTTVARVLRELEIKKQDAALAAACSMPMAGYGVVAFPPSLRRMSLDEKDMQEFKQQTQPAAKTTLPKKPRKGTQSKGPQ